MDRRISARVRLAAGLALAAVLALAVALGRAWGDHSGAGAVGLPPPARVVAGPTPAGPPPDRVAAVHWRAVVAELERRRAAAYDAGAPGELAALYDASSRTGAADLARLRRLARLDLHARGFAGRVVRVVVRSADTTHALLVVTDRLTRYDVVDGHGRVVARRPARARRSFFVRLVEVTGGWRIAAVRLQ